MKTGAFSEPDHVRLNPRSENWTTECVYWDETASNWSTNGCERLELNETFTRCSCNHLTNFAVLLDMRGSTDSSSSELPWQGIRLRTRPVYLFICTLVSGYGTIRETGRPPAVKPEPVNIILRTLTILGSSISIVCLVLSAMVFATVRGIQPERATVHLNLSICLLLSQVILLAGLDRTENETGCGIVAGLLHFWLLASFAWMLVEGVQIYLLLYKVFGTGSSSVLPYALFAYGVPMGIVIVTASVTQGTVYGTKNYCWLSLDDGGIWAFAGPAAIILLGESRRVRNKKGKGRLKEESERRGAETKGFWLSGQKPFVRRGQNTHPPPPRHSQWPPL
ncbi:unnamed protein product [Darwinula stevensoni]|uniref:Uncharacterized protein n=1 Tax=Darwinula stevensoni TaxID=69355 RepID=A0A7R9AE39_9CRUS|nr:unnamed protein product [Darwinula stevensoni]CAG0901692.1 unnamed protein product [Darwinula stevensoni]